VTKVNDLRDLGESGADQTRVAAERIARQLLVEAVRENGPVLQSLPQIHISMTAAFQELRAHLTEAAKVAASCVMSHYTFADFDLKRIQPDFEPLLEAVELIAAIDALQCGDKNELRAWVEEHYGSKPDTILVAQLRSDIPPITSGPDAGAIIVYTRARADGLRSRRDRDRRVRTNGERTQQLYTQLPKSNNLDYMQALAEYEDSPKQMLKRVLPGVVFSVGEDVPLEDLRRQAQKLIKDDNRLLWQTRKLQMNRQGIEERKIISLDSSGKEFEDELDLALFLRMQDEQRQLNLMRRAGLSSREWQIVELQRELHSRAEIASRLGITESAVNTHASNAGQKLRKASGL
jgi:DNA-binding CsgD family transcriptional regulator